MNRKDPARNSGTLVVAGSAGPVSLRRLSARVSANLGVQSPRDLFEGIDLIPPSRLTKVRRLAKGSYAVVELARLRPEGVSDEEDPGVKVAVKRLRQSAYTERDVTCFAREAELLLHLEQHANICKLIGIGCERSRADMMWPSMFLVMEYAEGGSLQELLEAQMEDQMSTLYTYLDAIKWARQIGSAILELHTQQPRIIHRDIRSENVLLYARRGKNGTLVAKVADLGMHTTVIPGTKLSYDVNDVFNTSESTGNYCYLAPEVLRQEAYDEKVDVFGFGVVLYELFMKRSLIAYFKGQDKNISTAASEYAKQMEGGYRMPLADKLPAQLKKLIEECMAGDPATRPSMRHALVVLAAIEDSGALRVTDKMLPGCACSVM